MEFSRKECPTKTTLAFQEFKRHHTELNQHLWCYVPLQSYASYGARKSNSSITHEALKIDKSHPDSRRITPQLKTWQTHLKEFDNWMHLAMLMSAASYLEIYLGRVGHLAWLSNPCREPFGFLRLDGMSLLKAGVRRSEASLLGLQKGAWQSRFRCYRHLFGVCPVDLERCVGKLEQIRNLRNSVGHTFGRAEWLSQNNLQIRALPPAAGNSAVRLSRRRLTSHLGVIESVAVSIDAHLRHDHIGSFELMLAFHNRKQEIEKESNFARKPYVVLATHIAKMYGVNRMKTYCRGLIDYYNDLP
jgi:hypothetical protein